MSLIPSGFSKNAAAGGFYDHPIEQSLRFNDDDSAYLSRTPSSAGNRKTWTWSGWIKRGNLDTWSIFFGAGGDSSNQCAFAFTNLNKIYFINELSNTNYNFVSTPVYRDTSAWYHMVVAFDSTQATSTDRVKIYVNGEQVTAWDTAVYPAQNWDGIVNSTSYTHYVGKNRSDSSTVMEGYMAEVHFIDGTALDASSFGEFKSGVWIPKAYSGSYGTNGFYLDFGNSGSIGADVSGNGNNFTANNLAATDVVLDSPTNNFATWNRVDTTSAFTLSEGNLKVQTSGTQGQARTTMCPSTGKWYGEVVFTSVGNKGLFVGFSDNRTSYHTTGPAIGNGWVWYPYSGVVYNNGGTTGYNFGTTISAGDVIGLAMDLDGGTLKWYRNNSLIGTVTSIVDGNYGFSIADGTSSSDFPAVLNCGQDSSFAGNKTAQGNTDANGYGDFYYAPPSGYLALCTANLTVPDAMNPALDASPQDHFNTVLWSGNSTARSITGVGFQPDFTWIKARNYTVHHALTDAVRGAGTSAYNSNSLNSNTTYAEDYISAGYLSSFDTDGFSLDTDVYWDNVNMSGKTYAAWNWKANGSGVSNTDGSITSTVSANTDAGFSIVSYTGTGSTASVGHGLSQTPEVILQKIRNQPWRWICWFGATMSNNGDALVLDDTLAQFTAGNPYWDLTNLNSSTFGLGTNADANNSGGTHIAYCFHSVEGFSKFGSYTGNGSTDGTFVYTGFRPAFVMIKRTDNVSGWSIYDSERTPFNQINYELSAHLSDAEFDVTTTRPFDFLSNGFKIRGTNGGANASGGTYIYMAFAETSFKFSTGR